MTQKEKVKLDRKNKLKKFFLKTLHIISYILSIGFITILIISGCQSCKKTSGVSAESLPLQAQNYNEYEYIYSYKYLNSEYVHIDVATQKSLIDGYLTLDLDYQFTEAQANKFCVIPFNGALLTIDNYSYDSINFVMSFSTRLFTDGYSYSYYSYRLDSVYFKQDVLTYPWLLSYHPTSVDLYTASSSSVYLVFKDEPTDLEPFLYFFELSNKSSFIFNKNFNYNAPMAVANRSPYGNGVSGGTSQGTLFTKLVIDCGLFISNNQIFDRIEFWYQLSDGASFDFDGTIKQGPQGMWFYWTTYYVNSHNNTMIIVNSRDSVAYMPTSSSYGYYYANSSTWSNDNYRYITFLQNLSQSNKNQIEQFNNNNQNSYSGNIYVEGGDVFTLLGTCFYSLGDFFGLAILPGISIGVLFFLPLIVGIIVIMFHILKK